ncbi:phosphatidate cytidylyltransferase [Thermaurantiacus sp.]
MAGAETVPQLRGSSRPGSELGMRVISGLVLGAIALAALWAGGWAFAALVGGAAALMLWEWGAMHNIGPADRVLGILLLLTLVIVTTLGLPREALFVLAGSLGLVAAATLARRTGRNASWLGAGLVYAGLPAVALPWLRGQPDGLVLVLWLMTIVWATDILAYFAGRAIGGAKLAPAISPSKTWAGLIGGMVGAGAASALIASAAWGGAMLLHFALGAMLALVAQLGDLFESWLKRRAGVKDSGALIPGHGGVMDRVDGLVPVACVVAAAVALR